jgi:L,D-transpeptidase catalytic domain
MRHQFFARFVALFALVFASIVSVPASAGVSIRVSLSSQTLTATLPDGTVRKWAVSSGREGFRTPRGNYRPQSMKTYHWSRKYGGAMPHAIFFRGGYAIHGTSAVGKLGAPASHGCIRLAPGAARELFTLVKRHGAGSTRIAIDGTVPDRGRTMVASRKHKQEPRQVARVRAQPQLTVPAFAPIDVAPYQQPFLRLRGYR